MRRTVQPIVETLDQFKQVDEVCIGGTLVGKGSGDSLNGAHYCEEEGVIIE